MCLVPKPIRSRMNFEVNAAEKWMSRAGFVSFFSHILDFCDTQYKSLRI